MAEIIDGSLGGLRSVEYLEIVLGFILGVKYFNYFFSFFSFFLYFPFDG